MIDTVLNWMYYICAMVCMVSVGEWTFHWTTKDVRKHLLAGGIYVAGFILYVILFPELRFSSNIFYGIEILAWSLICEVKFRDKIGKIVTISFGVSVVESVVSVVIDIILGQTLGVAGSKLLRIILASLVLYILCRQKWYYEVIGYVGNLSKWKKVLILFVIILGTVVAAYGHAVNIILNNLEATVFFKFLITINLTTVMAVVIWLIIESHQKKYYLEQNHLKEEYIRMQQEYYKTIYEKDREMRSFRHDVANQIGLLQMLLERGEVNGAKAQLKSIHQDFSQAIFKKIQVGDQMLDAILSMMNQRALEKDVELQVEGDIKNQKNYDIYELCTIFSNAISNAVEACQSMQEKKRVLVKIIEHNHSMCFIFVNPATEEMYQAIIKEETTQKDKSIHGYGIRNIRHAVERLNGSMEYRYEDGKIELEICI